MMGKTISAVLILLLVLSACQNKGTATQANEKGSSLYLELGGNQRISQAVKGMVKKLHHDERLGELFSEVDDNELIKNFTDFICQLSDGDCEYQGASMEDAHAELFITKAEFDRFVSLFIFSMQDVNIPFSAQNKLLKRLADLRIEVIEL